MKQRVLVGTGGGADSAVTAVLLKNQGYQVLACHLVLSDPLPEYVPRDEEKKSDSKWKKPGFLQEIPKVERAPAYFRTQCAQGPSPEEIQAVFARFDISYYQVDLRGEFEGFVVDPTVHDLLQYRKPHPCYRCNVDLKIAQLVRKADELGCERIATGHYAQIVYESSANRYELRRAVDLSRDQTFELSGITQAQLARSLMPLGGLSQGMIRKLAAQFSLKTEHAPRKGVCFIDSSECLDFVEDRSSITLRLPGMVRTTEGDVVGEHQGLHRFRIGQTEGLDIQMRETQDPFYVVAFEASTNVLVVGRAEELLVQEFRVSDVRWISPVDEFREIRCAARLQSQTRNETVTLYCFENQMAHVVLDQPVSAVTSGERVVFYKGDQVLGTGRVELVPRR